MIEDNSDDAMLVKRAFKATDSCEAFVCRNLGEAKAYLNGAGMYANRDNHPFPNAIISDMHLGIESAVDFLKWLKGSSEFNPLPVYILTGTLSDREGALAKDLGALEVFRKPSNYEDLKGMVQDLAAKLCTEVEDPDGGGVHG